MDRDATPNIQRWLENIRQLPNWKHPYDLMQGHPLPTS
jgi:glutathione S-transferase